MGIYSIVNNMKLSNYHIKLDPFDLRNPSAFPWKSRYYLIGITYGKLDLFNIELWETGWTSSEILFMLKISLAVCLGMFPIVMLYLSTDNRLRIAFDKNTPIISNDNTTSSLYPDGMKYKSCQYSITLCHIHGSYILSPDIYISWYLYNVFISWRPFVVVKLKKSCHESCYWEQSHTALSRCERDPLKEIEKERD